MYCVIGLLVHGDLTKFSWQQVALYWKKNVHEHQIRNECKNQQQTNVIIR